MTDIELETGTLSLKKSPELDKLIGFAARANKKRGFLFVSKVLGKHIPSKPSAMKSIHKLLADKLRPLLDNKATLVIGFAETATGIGNGVYDELKLDNSFYIHTTRYNLSYKRLIEFREEHCHAPAHILYDVHDPHLKELLLNAENIVLVDDEVTSGKTLANIVRELRHKFPSVKNYFAVSILNWMPEFSSDIKYIYLYNDRFSFQPKDFSLSRDFVSETDNPEYLDYIIPSNFGRFGIKESFCDYSEYVSPDSLKDKKVLVLGTGEFMHQSFLLAKFLEDYGIDVYVQSSSRSPILEGHEIKSSLEFKDNYGENIDNFLYNVIDKFYDKILICYETAFCSETHNLKELLEKYFDDVEELFLKK